jgi:hypothetical protein
MYNKKFSTSPTARRLYATIHGEPINKEYKTLSGNKETDREILQAATDEDLINFCKVNPYINSLCKEDTFWATRTIRRFGKILGTGQYILEHYKPLDIPWKDYYLWILDGIDGDPFFTYVKADSLGREDILKVLEYEYPQYFSDMDQIYTISQEMQHRMVQHTHMASSALNKGLERGANLFNTKRISFHTNKTTKKILLYVLASYALEAPVKCTDNDNRNDYSMPLISVKNLNPFNLIQVKLLRK